MYVPNLINHIRTNIPELENRVFGIIDLEHALSELAVEEFTVYVTHSQETQPEPMPGNILKIQHTFLIYGAHPLKTSDFRGEEALFQLTCLRNQLLKIFWNWRIAPNFEPMVYNGGAFVKLANQAAFHVYEFTITEQLSKSCLLNYDEIGIIKWTPGTLCITESECSNSDITVLGTFYNETK